MATKQFFCQRVFENTFDRSAHHSYQGGTKTSLKNRQTLRDAMEEAGFVKNPMEWWHWDLPDAITHPILDEPLEAPVKAP